MGRSASASWETETPKVLVAHLYIHLATRGPYIQIDKGAAKKNDNDCEQNQQATRTKYCLKENNSLPAKFYKLLCNVAMWRCRASKRFRWQFRVGKLTTEYHPVQDNTGSIGMFMRNLSRETDEKQAYDFGL